MNVNVKNKWENELSCNISPADWEQMCKKIHVTTNSKYWKEYTWKIIIRYFNTPQIQSKYKKNITPRCWREQMANHSHIFWSCKAIRGFWENSIRELSNIFGISLNKNPLILLLGKISEEIKKKDSYLLLVIRDLTS